MNAAALTIQAPTALLAVVTHIHDHGLGAPITIHSPSTASPAFTIGITAASYDAWLASGFTPVDTSSHNIGQRISGKQWEQVTTTGLLQPYGIRVVLKFARPCAEHRTLVAVTDGCFQ